MVSSLRMSPPTRMVRTYPSLMNDLAAVGPLPQCSLMSATSAFDSAARISPCSMRPSVPGQAQFRHIACRDRAMSARELQGADHVTMRHHDLRVVLKRLEIARAERRLGVGRGEEGARAVEQRRLG